MEFKLENYPFDIRLLIGSKARFDCGCGTCRESRDTLVGIVIERRYDIALQFDSDHTCIPDIETYEQNIVIMEDKNGLNNQNKTIGVA
jgi:hypothetical protein